MVTHRTFRVRRAESQSTSYPAPPVTEAAMWWVFFGLTNLNRVTLVRIRHCHTVTPFVFGFLGEANKAVRETIKDMASIGSEYLWRQMGQTCQNNAYGILLRKLTRTLGVAATRANARMRLRVLGTLFGRRDDSQYNRASREEARFREAEWDNYLRHGPRGHAEYHHGSSTASRRCSAHPAWSLITPDHKY